MFQTSLDSGDIASITSGLDNENKKPKSGILKTKRNSIKRKVQNFSLESDDAVIEPLLQKDKESNEIGNQSAKYLPSKTKIDCITEKGDDRDKLLADKKTSMPSMTCVPGVTNNAHFTNDNVKDSIKSNGSTLTPMHNHMNTNVFSNNDVLKGMSLPKTQMLVEIESTKQSGYSPSPLIFTTAKIHTDGKSKQMEPVHVTPVPILSTIEGNVIKTGTVTNYSKGVNEKFWRESSDNKQNTQDINVISKNQVSSAPLSGLPNKTTSAANTKENSVNKIIITSSTLNQVTQAPRPIDVKTTKVESVPLTCTTNTIHCALIKSEQSATASINKEPKSILEKMKPLTHNTETDNSILTPITSSTSEINKTDTVTKVIEMDINKNIQSTNSITPPKPGTSNKVDSSSKTKIIPDASGKETILTPGSSFRSNEKIQRQEHEIIESSLEPDSKQTATNSHKTVKAPSLKVNSDRNQASHTLNSSNLKSGLVQPIVKSTTPSITAAVSSVVSSISSSVPSHVQTLANMSTITNIAKDSTVSVSKSSTTNDLIATSSNGMKITTTNTNANVLDIGKTQSAATTSSVTSAVSKVLTVSTAESRTVITTSPSCVVKDMKISVAKTLVASTPIITVETTKSGGNSNVTSTTKNHSEAGTKSTSSVSKTISKPSTVSTAKTSVVTTTSQSLVTVNDSASSVTKPLNTSTHVAAAASSPKMTTTSANTNVTSTKLTSSVTSAISKPATISTAKTPAIMSQSSTTASQSSSKSTITNVKSTAAPKMSQTSTAKTVAGTISSTSLKPSTVTTMKSSAGQKVNTSITPKSAIPKSAAPVVSTSTSIKKVFNEQSDKKASASAKDGKGPKG